MTQIANRLLVTRGISTAPRVTGVTLNAATAPDMVDPVVDGRPAHPVTVRLPARQRRPPRVLPDHVLHGGPTHHRPRHVGGPTVLG